MMLQAFILDGKTPIPVDFETWSKWFGAAERHVNFETIGEVQISTVFIGIDHRVIGDGQPLIFETMIFGGAHDHYTSRSSTWDEAEAKHAEAIALVRDVETN